MQIKVADLEHVMRSKTLPIEPRLKMEILDMDEQYLDEVWGAITSGTFTISAESDVRRTCSITFTPYGILPIKHSAQIKEGDLIWINHKVRLKIGYYDRLHDTTKWYTQGVYMMTDGSMVYDATTHQLTINCSDLVVNLDASMNGQSGAYNYTFPAYVEDEITGEPLKANLIRDAIISILDRVGITRYQIDEIGDPRAMEYHNKNWQQFRQEHSKISDGPDGEKLIDVWDAIPYDQEFSAGSSYWSMLSTFRDIYSNYEMYFDEEGVFICRLIPTGEEDPIIIDDKFFQDALISENTSIDFKTVRNVSEVWGQVIDCDFYSDEVRLNGNTYVSTIKGYINENDEEKPKYYTGDKIALLLPSTNPANAQINISNLGQIPIVHEKDETPIEAGFFKAGEVYAFKIKQKYENRETKTMALYIGKWQAHAMCVLSNGFPQTEYVTIKSLDTGNNISVKKYSKDYFHHFYNVDYEDIEFMVIPDTPFAIEKIGIRHQVLSGGEYDNIDTDELAIERARWENYKSARLTDSISLNILYSPFLDVNIKISYRRHDQTNAEPYIIKSVTHDFSGGTTTIDMMRFYPLYESRVSIP